MVRHIVMFKFKEENKVENVRTTKEMLDALPAKIPLIKGSETHIGDKAQNPANYDLILISDFESFEALNEYIVHPDHKKVGEFMKPVRENRTCIDIII